MEASAVRFLVVHCSASPPSVNADAIMIDRWHRERGFRKIGYHYVITRRGNVQVGRLIDEAGAHAQGYNDCSIGICLAGGVDASGKPENNFTKAQFESLRWKLGELVKKFPKAAVLGHRDLPGVKKDCPSFDVRQWWATKEKS